jgi:hypothetical protein
MKKTFLVIFPFIFFAGVTAIKLGCSKTPAPPLQCRYSSAWTTVSEVSIPHSVDKGLGTLLGTDPLFSLGLGKNATDRWTERTLQISFNGAKDWSPLEILRPGENVLGVLAAKEGSLFTMGSLTDLDGKKHWLVKLTGDNGNTWVSVDQFHPVPGLDSEALGGVLVSARELYVVGVAAMGPSQYQWVVRHTIDGGEHWKTADQLNYGGAGASQAKGVSLDSSGNVYVSGTVSDGIKKHWLVRKSSDQGESWTTVQDFQSTPAQDSVGGQILVDNSDNLFAAGSALDSMGHRRWIIRRSESSGNHWTTVEDFPLVAGAQAEVSSVAVSRSAVLFAAGTIYDSAKHPHWLVRRSLDKGATWTTTDEFTDPTDSHSQAESVGVDGAGNVYVSGYVSDPGAPPKAVLRRQTCD